MATSARRNGRLDRYRSRRDFRKTPEPSGRGDGEARGDGAIFVVHEHDARTHHYDLRIEVDGVLRSWAVPKGPSTDPREQRLAVETEPHPMEYADFEGVIPEEEYGAGAVIVWDRGSVENISRDDRDRPLSLGRALERGKAEVWLEGEKIRGGYALIHTELRGNDRNWLLVKMRDEAADARRNPTSTEPKSPLSGRRVDEVGGGGEDGE